MFDFLIDDDYQQGAVFTGLAAWLIIWVCTWFTMGMWGFLLGWIPAAILAFVLGLMWPLTLGAIGLGVLYLLNQ